MIRLAFGPEALLHTVMAEARKDLGLLPAPGSGPGSRQIYLTFPADSTFRE
jgi:hypothetical protein